MDRITNLPPGITDAVLSLLPIEEAARTSILSKAWRYRWITIPKLAFFEDAFKLPTDGAELSAPEREMARRCKLLHVVNKVLLMHQGAIHEFTLSMEGDDPSVEIDRILLHLSKENTVKRLKLEFRGLYALPSSFFSFTQLTNLHLDCCHLDLQPSFAGFGSLTTLYLHEVEMTEKELLRLLSSCPLLKRVAIMVGDLQIRSIGGPTIGDPTLDDLFKCLQNIEHLSIWFYIVWCYAPDSIPKKLPTTLVHLKYLFMNTVCFNHIDSFPFLALFIRSSPNLEKLKIEIVDEDELHVTGPFTLEDYSDIMLEHLNELQILQFSNLEKELVFVQLILARSPSLKDVRIFMVNSFDKDNIREILESISSYPCASPQVNFIVV